MQRPPIAASNDVAPGEQWLLPSRLLVVQIEGRLTNGPAAGPSAPWHFDCDLQGEGGTRLNKRTLGILAGVVGSAIGTWWWARQRTASSNARNMAAGDHGTVIYRNTPTAAVSDVL